MKITCGVDIIEISRIKKSIEEFGQKFLKRLFTQNEIDFCESKKNNRYQHYSGKFAAKEAIYKAISGVQEKGNIKLDWKDVEIIKDNNNRPKVVFLNDILLKHIDSIDVSISHCVEYAISNVTVVWRE